MLTKIMEEVIGIKGELKDVKDGIKNLDERITKMELPIASSSKIYKFY